MPSSETPVRFSQDLVNSLQSSPESDSTRAKDLELHIQTRVAAELKRLEAQTSQSLKDLEEAISATPDDPAAKKEPPQRDGEDGKGELSRASVQKEIEALKQKLSERQVREDVLGDGKVNGAREEVVKCLRGNDRRPLDCWKEVESFKREVGKLEGQFVEKVIS